MQRALLTFQVFTVTHLHPTVQAGKDLPGQMERMHKWDSECHLRAQFLHVQHPLCDSQVLNVSSLLALTHGPQLTG